MDSQSIIALAIVAITVLIFAYRIFRKPDKGCGGGCSCEIKPKIDLPKPPSFDKKETTKK